MAFNKQVITVLGKQLLAKSLQSKKMKLKCIRIGDGTYSGNYATLERMVHPLFDVGIDISQTDNLVTLSANLAGHSEYYLREVGIIAEDEANKEILFAYDNAGSNAEFIPDNGNVAVEKTLRFGLVIDDDINFTVSIPGNAYATLKDFSSHTSDNKKHLPSVALNDAVLSVKDGQPFYDIDLKNNVSSLLNQLGNVHIKIQKDAPNPIQDGIILWISLE